MGCRFSQDEKKEFTNVWYIFFQVGYGYHSDIIEGPDTTNTVKIKINVHLKKLGCIGCSNSRQHRVCVMCKP